MSNYILKTLSIFKMSTKENTDHKASYVTKKKNVLKQTWIKPAQPHTHADTHPLHSVWQRQTHTRSERVMFFCSIKYCTLPAAGVSWTYSLNYFLISIKDTSSFVLCKLKNTARYYSIINFNTISNSVHDEMQKEVNSPHDSVECCWPHA